MNAKNGPKVSVIVPAYNVGRYISQCICSIRNQTYSNIEIIVVNDGSTDETKNIIDELSLADNRIIPIHKANEGVSIARNSGLQKATGEYVAFVDGDDFLAPDYVEYMLSLILMDNAEFALSLNCFTKRNEAQIKADKIVILNQQDTVTLLLSPRIIVGAWNKIYSRKMLQSNNIKFSPLLYYGEGLRFITQVAQNCNKAVVGIRKVYYYRRDNETSATTQFNVNKLYNGEKSLELIQRDLKFNFGLTKKILCWHICQFKMGIAVRIKACNVEKDYKQYYISSLQYVRDNCLKFIFTPKLSLYKKLLLIGCAVSPAMMAYLDKIRRARIKEHSVIVTQNTI